MSFTSPIRGIAGRLPEEQTLEVRFSCYKCTGTHPAIMVTLTAREAEILPVCCPICKTPLFKIQVEARN